MKLTRRHLLAKAGALAVSSPAIARPRTYLEADISLFVHPKGDDRDPQGGEDTPLGTMQEARRRIRDRYDLTGHIATIRLMDGVHTTGLVAAGTPPGQVTARHFPIIGNTSHPERCIIETTDSNCFTIGVSAGGFAHHYLDGVELHTRTTSGFGAASAAIEMNFRSSLILGPNVIFGTCEGPLGIHIWFHTGGDVVGGPRGYTVRGSLETDDSGNRKRTMGYHVMATKSSQAILHNMTVRLLNEPRFGCWAGAFIGSVLEMDGNQYEGKGFGQRFLSDSAIIHVGGKGPDYFPGDIDGQTKNGGVYG